jgi:integrase
MHAVYEYGMFEEVCSSNPCSGWRLKGVKSEYKAITVTPEQTLMILKSMTDTLYFTLVFTVAATALRASEVVALRWSDIMWNENRIRVSKRWRKGKDGKPKTAASDSTVALGSILASYLRAWKDVSPYTADTDFVFPSRTKNGSVPVCASVFVRNHLRKAAVAAGAKIPDGYRFGLHNLRHSLSNWLVNRGKVDPKTVQEMLRHAKVQTTLDLYTQGDNDNKISAQDKFCGLIVDQEAV